jgi:hypothetical protein
MECGGLACPPGYRFRAENIIEAASKSPRF